MIEIYVNNKRKMIPTRAMQKLNDLMVGWGGRCCEWSAMHSPYWGCTRVSGHPGIHVAHGSDDNGTPDTYAVFMAAIPDSTF